MLFLFRLLICIFWYSHLDYTYVRIHVRLLLLRLYLFRRVPVVAVALFSGCMVAVLPTTHTVVYTRYSDKYYYLYSYRLVFNVVSTWYLQTLFIYEAYSILHESPYLGTLLCSNCNYGTNTVKTDRHSTTILLRQ